MSFCVTGKEFLVFQKMTVPFEEMSCSMVSWSDLPKEIHLEIFEYTVGKILKEHVDRITPSNYWRSESGYNPDLASDYDSTAEEVEYGYHWRSLPWYGDGIYLCIMEHGDACEYSEPYKHSQLILLLLFSKTFLTADDLKTALLRCGLVCWRDDPRLISDSKTQFTRQQRQSFDKIWIRPRFVPTRPPLPPRILGR